MILDVQNTAPARPAAPPIPGITSEQVCNSDSIFGLTTVPEKIAIIGGGYIGLEFACFFNEIGSKVVVFEAMPAIAAGADQEISARLLQILKRQGVDFRLSRKVREIRCESALKPRVMNAGSHSRPPDS